VFQRKKYACLAEDMQFLIRLFVMLVTSNMDYVIYLMDNILKFGRILLGIF